MTNSNSKKVIVGLGQTGLSCARFLAGRKESFTVVDSRQSPPGLEELQALYPQIPVELGEFNEQTFMGADELIVSPGVDLRISVIQKAIANGVRIRGDVDLFARQVKQPLVAVTGSNAKSTVVTLVGEMARQSGVNVAVAGNIGTPVLDLLNGGDEDIYVLELSSFQLETTTTLGAEVATVLNMSADHLDRYESMQAYHRAKHRIFQGCKQVVINRDDALSAPLLPPHVKRWSFGLSVPDFNEFGLLS
ncbi:MAG: Mur ligase family protein, partial [Pseudohongiellaceae bacterium]